VYAGEELGFDLCPLVIPHIGQIRGADTAHRPAMRIPDRMRPTLARRA
jgi:hypothetical protein